MFNHQSLQGVHLETVDPFLMSPEMAKDEGLLTALRKCYKALGPIREEFMCHPKRDLYDRPLHMGFEVSERHRVVVYGDIYTGLFNKKGEITTPQTRLHRPGFVAEGIEFSLVGKPDLVRGDYEGFGLELDIGDIVVRLISRTDMSIDPRGMYERTIVKYDEVRFECFVVA